MTLLLFGQRMLYSVRALLVIIFRSYICPVNRTWHISSSFVCGSSVSPEALAVRGQKRYFFSNFKDFNT